MVDAKRLEMARTLVRELESGNERQADEIVHQIARGAEHSLFEEVGKLTRELHDALVNVERDARLAGIAENEIPDAKERLKYVIEKTEAAAHRTLNAVEDVLPIADRLGKESVRLNGEWSRFTRREMNVGEFKRLAESVGELLQNLQCDSVRLQENLSEVLLAQDYQDLTGQVIRKVIELVQEVEDKLVDLVRVSGVRAAKRAAHKDRTGGEGLRVHPKDLVVANQDEVDDLLSSLGF